MKAYQRTVQNKSLETNNAAAGALRNKERKTEAEDTERQRERESETE